MVMYSDVYFHRTTRALDLQMREVFAETMAELLPENPALQLDRYLGITEWYLLQKVQEWAGPVRSDITPQQRALGQRWRDILDRRVMWKMAHDHVTTMNDADRGKQFWTAEKLKDAIREHLAPELRDLPLEVDLATQDARPVNPLAEGGKTINVFNPATGEVSPRPLREFFKDVPARVAHYRIFAKDHQHDRELADAAERALGAGGPDSIGTNV
jgi:hypothetical protein